MQTMIEQMFYKILIHIMPKFDKLLCFEDRSDLFVKKNFFFGQEENILKI